MTLTYQLDAPARAIWSTLSDFHNIGRWMPVVVRAVAEVQGNGAGALRTCWTGDGTEMLDRLEAIDTQSMTMTYSIVEAIPPLPFRGYRATISLRQLAPDKTELKWSCAFLPRGAASADDIKNYVKSIYQVGIDELSRLHAGR